MRCSPLGRVKSIFNVCNKLGWSFPQVVRGGPAFAVSLVLSAVEPALREAAELSSWQIISPRSPTGVVVVVNGLHEVQDKVRAGSLRSHDLSVAFSVCEASTVLGVCKLMNDRMRHPGPL